MNFLFTAQYSVIKGIKFGNNLHLIRLLFLMKRKEKTNSAINFVFSFSLRIENAFFATCREYRSAL